MQGCLDDWKALLIERVRNLVVQQEVIELNVIQCFLWCLLICLFGHCLNIIRN
jgi:hypothetical protein